MAIKNWFKNRGFAGVVLLAMAAIGFCWCPLTPIFGSWAAFFSAKAMFFPLVGAFTGVWGAAFFTGVRLLVRSLWGAALDAHILAHFLPGLCASLSWATRSVFIHVGLPLVCMLLFAIHPVGAHVWYYSLYWLIPVGIYMSKNKVSGVFLSALGSTFISHAVGSLIWLYTVPMSVSVWQALLPLVVVERLVFAAGMSAGYFVIVYGVRTIGFRWPLVWGYVRSLKI
ncbi:hypothetical protein [Methylicorpusculum sp.]|uniref:hypothetical protein n=1 Tax=Methylicorpusculum sp. TaxID=2713644 RepID=UPI002AB91759|nr:hypothetical protein [Methylicorpusculum sp.]MDZ4154212.1 hypothetical protein [Methylicorpusculum sp.]